MFIRFESSIAGMNFSYAPGDVVEWPDEGEAERFVQRGIAEQLLSREKAQEAAQSAGRPVRRHRSPERATAKNQAEHATQR
jgi:hypothetical protein